MFVAVTSNTLPLELGARIDAALAVDEPLTVGADRLINTLAASRLLGRDTIIVDLGTATTYDCITSDGVFLGGVIAVRVLLELVMVVFRIGDDLRAGASDLHDRSPRV